MVTIATSTAAIAVIAVATARQRRACLENWITLELSAAMAGWTISGTDDAGALGSTDGCCAPERPIAALMFSHTIGRGSMEPTIHVGGLALDRAIPSQKVRVGDVITFSDPYVKDRLVTHRVIDILQTPHGLAYRTKGDANSGRDPWTIRLAGQVGRVSFSVPVAGYILYYAHTREIRSLLICLAALSLLVGILRRIWRKEETAPAGA